MPLQCSSAPMDTCWGSGLPFFPEDGALSVLTPSTPTSCSTIPVATVRTAAPRQPWGSARSSVCVPVHSFLAACGEGSGRLAGQACACLDRRTSMLSRSPTSLHCRVRALQTRCRPYGERLCVLYKPPWHPAHPFSCSRSLTLFCSARLALPLRFLSVAQLVGGSETPFPPDPRPAGTRIPRGAFARAHPSAPRTLADIRYVSICRCIVQ